MCESLFKFGPITLLCIFFAACEKEPSELIEADVENCWEQSHTGLFFLAGKPKEVCESIFLQDELMQSTLLRFNTEGKLIHYNPAYDPASTRSFDWGSSNENYSAYSYEYNDKGQLQSVSKNSFGEDLGRFEFGYGDHGKYIPMPVPMGNQTFYLLKNLISVKMDGKELLSFTDENEVVFTKHSFLADQKLSYSFHGIYPIKAVAISERDGHELNRIETKYNYASNGALVWAQSVLYENSLSKETITLTYSSEQLMKPITKESVYSLSSRIWNYDYGIQGWLIGVSLVNNKSESIAAETNDYESPDIFGNWTKRLRNTSSVIDETVLAEGQLMYTRSIVY